IAGDPSLGEIILSGGDPLSLSDARLAALVEQLAAIPHVRRLRIHTRLPIVLPSRVNQELTGWLTRLPLQKVLVVHANHAREIDEEIAKALRDLRNCGVTLLNQSVLLRGVNDSTAALATLSETLFAAGVLPYYLHLLDKVQGAAHFDVPEAEARLLLSTLRDRLPGYLVPRLVREIEGEASKRPIV
ncbi:MAG: KamA family radical SAM protein, partial [Pseudomonadota bacterium]